MPLDHLLRLALRRLEAQQRAQLAALALTPRQVEVLAALQGRGGMRQRELARQVGMDASTLAEMAARLARRGLIRRQPHRRDGRALALYLTPKGRRMLQRARPLVAAADAAFLEVLRGGQRQAFLHALGVLCGESGATEARHAATDGRAADGGEKG